MNTRVIKEMHEKSETARTGRGKRNRKYEANETHQNNWIVLSEPINPYFERTKTYESTTQSIHANKTEISRT